MSGRAEFSPQEWELVCAGPPSAGVLVMSAQRGGVFRESFAMAKAYADARKGHGQSQLLDDLVAEKPKLDHTRYRSLDELKEHSLGHLRDAVALLEGKVTPQELDEYKRFIINLADEVAHAHREHGRGGDAVSSSEQAATHGVGGLG